MEPYGLTEREQQIVTMIVDGQTLGGIAEELFITERTVKFHSKNAYDKLGVHNKKELMQMFSER
nr:helix-turn-helix transcriptional regulator [Gordonibacter urolithinfaciens]